MTTTMLSNEPTFIGSSPTVVSPPSTPDSTDSPPSITSESATSSSDSHGNGPASKKTTVAHKKNSTSTRTRRKWKKPKDKPKRPLSAYNLYFKDERERILRGEVPNWTKARGFRAMAQFIAAKWNNLDSTSRSFYEARAMEEKKGYFEALAHWKRQKKQQEILKELKAQMNIKGGSVSDQYSFMQLQQQHQQQQRVHRARASLPSMPYRTVQSPLQSFDLYQQEQPRVMRFNENKIDYYGNRRSNLNQIDLSFLDLSPVTKNRQQGASNSLEPLPISFEDKKEPSTWFSDDILSPSFDAEEALGDSIKNIFDHPAPAMDKNEPENQDMKRVLATFDVLGVDDELMDFMSGCVWK